MNQKANRQQIVFPPLLNLANDRPKIDTNFQNFEKNNAPYLNGMIQPIYTKETSGAAVYDNKGNRYTVAKDSGDNKFYVYKDGVKLFEVSNSHFEKEEVFFEGNGTACEEFYQVFDDKENKVKVYSSEDSSLLYTSSALYSNGVYYKGRIGTFTARNGNKYFVSMNVYRDDNDDLKLEIICQYQMTIKDSTVSWKRFYSYNDTMTAASVTIDNPNILIQSAQKTDGDYDIWWVTLFSDYGEVVPSKDFGIYNYVFGFTQDAGASPLGQDGEPEFLSNNSTRVVPYVYSADFNVRTSVTSLTVAKMNLVSNDGGATVYRYVTYYDPVEEEFYGTIIDAAPYNQANFSNLVNTMEPVKIGDRDNYVTYYVFSATPVVGITVYNTTSQMTVLTNNGGISWSFKTQYKTPLTDISISETGADGGKFLRYDVYWINESEMLSGFDDCTISWQADAGQIEPVDTPVPSTYWNNENITLERHFSQTETISTSLVPNAIFDNGSAYSLFDFTVQTGDSWDSHDQISNGYEILESGTPSFQGIDSSTPWQISYSEIEQFTNTTGAALWVRSRSMVIGQNFYAGFTRLSNAGQTPKKLCPQYDSSGNITEAASTDITSARYYEYMNSNSSDLRYSPGSVYDREWNYYGYATNDELYKGSELDALSWVIGGFRNDLNDNWHLLYNVYADGSAMVQGISYSESSTAMGTLVVPWSSIDPTFDVFISDNGTAITYKDIDGHYYKISVADGAQLSTILDDRYVLVNTTSFWNAIDSDIGRLYHYATDYNGRLLQGESALYGWGPEESGIRITANAINFNYNAKPKLAFTSNHYPYATVQRVKVGSEVIPGCESPESLDVQTIDVYFSDVNKTECLYRYSIIPQSVLIHTKDFQLINSNYTISSTGSATLTPSIFAVYINGKGNNDMLLESRYGYPLTYAEDTPILAYSLASETDNAQDFFVLQGQFYGIINDKIYAMTYDNGIISDKQAIVDIKGFKFIGNTTQIAFFWSPRFKALYSWTGDANLLFLFDASKIDSISGKYFYDECTQSIFVPTNAGTLVLGPKNSYFIEDWKNVDHVYFTKDDLTHVIFADKTIDFVYYPTATFEPKTIVLETSFWGTGSNETGTIDRFDIVLYDISGEKLTHNIKVGTRSITDVTVKSEEIEKKITPDMWDKWSNSVLISYSPKLIKGKGIRLYLDSDVAIQSITAHYADQGTGTVTGRNRSI